MNKGFNHKSRLFIVPAILGLLSGLTYLVGCAGAISQVEPTMVKCAGVDTSELQGTIKGRWRGQVTSEGVSGSFTLTISATGEVSGRYDGPDSGPIFGCIDEIGGFKSGGTGANFVWEGQFRVSGGKVTGSGRWVWSGGDGTGIWSGKN